MVGLLSQTMHLFERLHKEVKNRSQAAAWKALLPVTSGFASLDGILRKRISYVPSVQEGPGLCMRSW